MARPPKYTLEQLEEIIGGYWKKMKEDKKVPTKVNFLSVLDVSRKTYNEWKKDDHEFSNTIKKVELEIEDIWLQRLEGSSTGGAIFYLKNAFAYRDRLDTDVTSKGEKITPIYNGQSVSRHQSYEKDIQSGEKNKGD